MTVIPIESMCTFRVLSGNFEKEIKRLDAERDTAWREYDGAAKDIELNKDKLIDGVEKQLNQLVTEEELFLIKWELK